MGRFAALRWLGLARLDDWVALHAARRPHDDAVVGAERVLSWRDLDEAVERRGLELSRRSGLRSTHVVEADDAVDVLVDILASQRRGLVPCLIPRDIPRYEARRLIAAVAELEQRTPDLTSLRDANVAANAGRGPDAMAFAPGVVKPAWGALLASSGTTGTPKLVPIPHDRLLFSGHVISRAALDLGPTDRVWCPLPLQHATGLVVVAAACLVAGSALLLPRGFELAELRRAVSDQGATVMAYVAETLARCVQSEETYPALRGLRSVIGVGCDRELWRDLHRIAPSLRIRELYGATESPLALLNLDGEPGAVGRIPRVLRRLVRVVRVEEESGALLRSPLGELVSAQPGAPGELLIRSQRVWGFSLGSYDGTLGGAPGPELVEDCPGGSRWLRTGDRVRMTSQGHVYFEGRVADVLRIMGSNVSLAAVERGLSHCLAGRQYVAYGLNTSRGGAVLALGIVGAPPWERLHRAVVELPAPHRPRLVRVLSTLPRGPTLRVQRRLLVESPDGPRGTDLDSPRWVLSSCGYRPLTASEYDAWLRELR